MVLMWLWLAGAAWAGDCDGAALQEAIRDAEGAFASMDSSGFDAAVKAARVAVACAEQPLTPVQCAGFHRIMALEAFLDRKEDDAVLDFVAVRATQPGYQLPESIAPQDHPLRQLFDQSAEFASGGTFTLPPPAGGGWLDVDGSRAEAAPSNRPFVLQYLDGSGVPKVSGYVPVGGKVPEYPVGNAPKAKSEGGGGLSPVGWAGIGAAAVGAGLYGAAFATHGSYDRAVESGDADQIRSLHGTTNALTVGGVGLLGGGATLLVVGVL